MLSRFEKVVPPQSGEIAFMEIAGAVSGQSCTSVPLVAKQCDVHPDSGRVDVLSYLEQDMKDIVTHKMFEEGKSYYDLW